MSVLVSVTTCHHPRCTNDCPEGHVCCSEECAHDLQALGMLKRRYYSAKRELQDRARVLNWELSTKAPRPSKVAKLKAEIEQLKSFAAGYRLQLEESGIEF